MKKLALSFVTGTAFALSSTVHAASWKTTTAMITARYYHTATLLANGKVLVMGGVTGGNSTEVFDVTTNIWSNTAIMATASYAHTATLLANGKVLVTGGIGGGNSARLLDVITNTWSNTAAMATARYAHTATLLANGQVLVTGGHDGNVPVKSAELFDVTTGTWRNTGAMAAARFYHTATLLANGKVLVASGWDGNASVNSVEVFDVTTNTWSSTGAMVTPRYTHTATMLPNGKVLVTGGHTGNAYVNSAELFDVTTNTWSNTAAMATARSWHTATLLANNSKVLVTGGYTTGNAYVNSAELFDVTANTWSNTAAMATVRSSHTATMLANGQVLVAGGYNSTGKLARAELYTPDAVATTTTLTSSRNPSVVSQSVIFTAKVADTIVPTGTVTFKVDGITKAANSLSNGQTTHTTTNLAIGNRIIRAEYAGNTAHAASAAQLTQTVTTEADFVITNLSLNPLIPLVNQAFTVRGVVKNPSTVAGAAGNLSIWLDKTDAVSCNAPPDQVIAIGTLAAGASKAFNASFTAAAASGNKTLRTFVDSACATLETNESNNQVTKTYTVGAPDLTVTNITLTPDVPATGATFTARVVIKNQGLIPISSSFLDLWLDKSTTQNCGAASERWETIDTLAAGASQTIIFSGLIAATTTGNKTLRVYADSWCETEDVNRNNNQLTKTYTVGNKADFVINSVTLIPSFPAANRTFSAIAIVTNQGTLAGNGGNLTVWFNQATTQSCNATGDKVVAVGTLSAGATSPLTVTGLVAGSAGVKNLRVFVDSTCVTSEANETNNQLMQSYTVQ